MKLCYFNDFTLGVVKGDAVVDVSAVVRDIPHTGPHNLINGLIERFSQYRGKLEKAADFAACGNSRVATECLAEAFGDLDLFDEWM